MKSSIFAVAAIAIAAGTAHGGYTPIYSNGSEPDLYQIFTTTYGTLTGVSSIADISAGNSFHSSQGYTFTRVQDFIGSGTSGTVGTNANLHSAVGAGTTDQRFSDGTTAVNFVVRWAGFDNHLGWSNQGAGDLSVYHEILGPFGHTTVHLSSDFQLEVAVNGGSAATYGSNDLSAPTPGNDHFVTWQVTGNGRRFFVVGIEDLNLGDADYNDWVGEIQAVPLPPAAWAGLSSLAGVMGFGYLRRRRMNAF